MKIIPDHNILLKINIFKNLNEYIDSRHPDSIFYHKNDNIYFELDKKNHILYCSYDLVWKILLNGVKLQFSDRQDLIKNIVEQHTNWGALTPIVTIRLLEVW